MYFSIAAAQHLTATVLRDLLATFIYIMFLSYSTVGRCSLSLRLLLQQPYWHSSKLLP